MEKTVLTIILIQVCCVCSFAQQSNNFEVEKNLPIYIDTANIANIWQVGAPDKTIFSSALSKPNALVTDTLNSYPVGNQSTFMFKMDMAQLWGSELFLILYWQQKMDCEPGVDGGRIDVSYDSMNTWVNVLEDDVFKPMWLGNMTTDTLFTGEPGLSRIHSNWIGHGICWNGYDGYPVDEAYIRFTFLSDSVDTHQEGWMIDQVEINYLIVDDLEDPSPSSLAPSAFQLFPNPAVDRVIVQINAPVYPKGQVLIHHSSGVLLYQQEHAFDQPIELDLSSFSPGPYWVSIKSMKGDILGVQKMIVSPGGK